MKLPALVVAVLVGVSTVSGCGDIDRTDYLNSTEALLFKMCNTQTLKTDVSCKKAYAGTISKTAIAISDRSPEDQPFKNQGLVFIVEDRAFKDKNPGMLSMNELWHKYTGKWLYNAPDASQAGDLKVVDDSYVLSPQLYDELITAVKTCNRAAVSSMQFKVGSVLPKDQYDQVMNIVLECKDYQLQRAINEK